MGKYANLFKDDFVFEPAIPEKTESSGRYANLFEDDFVFTQPTPQKAEEEEAEYSAVRSALVDFVESAVGVGDELDATIRLLSGDAQDWESAIGQSRRELSAFERDNPYASMTITGIGFGAAIFIPGAGLSKIAQAGTKVDRAIKGAGLTAAEGAAYGFLSGEEEEGRLTGAALGAGLGGVLGGVSGAFLTKNADEIKEATEKLESVRATQGAGTHIGGDGFVNKGIASGVVPNATKSDTSANARIVKAVGEGEELSQYVGMPLPSILPDPAASGSTFIGNIFLSTKEWLVKNVGERAAKLTEDSEIMIRYERQAIEETFDSDIFVKAAEMFENNRTLNVLALRMNKSIQKGRASWEDFSNAAKTPEEKEIAALLEEQIKQLQKQDFLKFSNVDYFPTKTVGKIIIA